MRDENSLLRERLAFLRDLYHDVLDDRRMLRGQIIGRRDSFGKMYAMTRELDEVQPQKLYHTTIRIMQDTLGGDSFGVYRIDSGANEAPFDAYDNAMPTHASAAANTPAFSPCIVPRYSLKQDLPPVLQRWKEARAQEQSKKHPVWDFLRNHSKPWIAIEIFIAFILEELLRTAVQGNSQLGTVDLRLFERISRRPAIAQSQHMIVCWVMLGSVFAKSHR